MEYVLCFHVSFKHASTKHAGFHVNFPPLHVHHDGIGSINHAVTYLYRI